eukprot:sb/3476495/
MVMSALHPPELCSSLAIVAVGLVLAMLSHSDLLSVCGRPLVLMVSMMVGFSGGPVLHRQQRVSEYPPVLLVLDLNGTLFCCPFFHHAFLKLICLNRPRFSDILGGKGFWSLNRGGH